MYGKASIAFICFRGMDLIIVVRGLVGEEDDCDLIRMHWPSGCLLWDVIS